MANVKYPANATHTAYGICKNEAFLSIVLYSLIVFKIRTSSNSIHRKAMKKAPKLKNIILHAKFTIRLEAYVESALLTASGIAERFE